MIVVSESEGGKACGFPGLALPHSAGGNGVDRALEELEGRVVLLLEGEAVADDAARVPV